MRSHRWEGCWPRRSPRTDAATAAEATASAARIQETRSSSAKAWTEPPTPPRVTAPDTRTRIHGRAHSIRIARPCEGWPTACIAATVISQAASIPFSTGSQPQNPPQPNSTYAQLDPVASPIVSSPRLRPSQHRSALRRLASSGAATAKMNGTMVDT